MLLHSPRLIAFNKGVAAAVLTVITTLPIAASATTPQLDRLSSPATSDFASSSVKHLDGSTQQSWLMAKNDKRDKDDKKEYKRGDDDDRYVRIDLNRAKNLARQAAEAANGGIRVYRAEDSMHGPANLCPYVDNGDSWTFTFLGGRPGAATKTIESVVTVYKNSPRVLVAYNGTVRSIQQTQVVNFTTSQRTVLVDLLRGNCECNYLLSDTLRSQIISQRSLPPGIQKQLLRGKGLPPGIAKKFVRLPKQVNTYVNLPAQYDLLVVGSNLVLVDQVRYVVVDMISSVF